jgi:hypothetical protein
MFSVRLGMSGAAWLKVFIENPGFLHAVQCGLLQPGQRHPSLAGDVPALRAIAGSKLPTGVEGISFDDWFTRQYILDTSVSVGRKVYALVTPDSTIASGLQSPSVTLNYFETRADGDEILLNGTAYATYLDSENNPVQAGEGSAPVQAGEGFFTVNVQTDQVSNVGRYSLNFAIGGLVARTYVPIGFTSDFQGVVVGGGSLGGNINVQQTTLPPVTTRGGTDQRQ